MIFITFPTTSSPSFSTVIRSPSSLTRQVTPGGGTPMGTDPKTSVVNKYLQSWDAHNLFVLGASVFPQNAGYNPTGAVGALTYWAADAVVNKYLKNPGHLMKA